MKRVDVGLSVQPVEDETVEEIMVQGGAVSPIVTIEPRRYSKSNYLIMYEVSKIRKKRRKKYFCASILFGINILWWLGS